MKRLITIVAVCLLVIGCQGMQRYGSRLADEEPPPGGHDTEQPSVGFRTNDYIRLGIVLQKYLGQPTHGISARPGLDCSSFTRQAFDAFAGISLPRTAEEQSTVGTEVGSGPLAYGDLVFFVTEGNKVSHVGVYIGFNEFIHASTSRGVIISSMNEEYWKKRFVGARRLSLIHS